MKIEIAKEDLVYAVSSVEKAVSAKNTVPVLSGIMISAKDNRVTFRATDLEMAIECTVNTPVEEEGELVAPGRKLSQLAKGLSAGNIILESSDCENLLIKYNRGQISMPCYDTEEFPLLPAASGDISGKIPVKVFRRLVRQTGIAASMDELRPVFTGMMLEIKDNDITFVATDTHRLTVGRGVWQGSGEKTVIVPNKVMQEVARLAANDDDNIHITVSKSQVFFGFANLQIASRHRLHGFRNAAALLNGTVVPEKTRVVCKGILKPVDCGFLPQVNHSGDAMGQEELEIGLAGVLRFVTAQKPKGPGFLPVDSQISPQIPGVLSCIQQTFHKDSPIFLNSLALQKSIPISSM